MAAPAFSITYTLNGLYDPNNSATATCTVPQSSSDAYVIVPDGGIFTIQDTTTGASSTIYAADGQTPLDPHTTGIDFDFTANTNQVSLTGSDFDSILHGGSGADTLIGGNRGVNTIVGGGGNDVITGGDDANNLLIAGDGSNVFLTGGNNASNVMIGGAGNDTFFGGAGDNTFELSQGTDVVHGNLNTTSNTISFDNYISSNGIGIFVTLANSNGPFNLSGTVTGENGLSVTFDHIQTIGGSDFADVLRGGSGNDPLQGGAGNDVLEGGAGADALNGGAGGDTASYEHAAAGVTANLGDSSQNTGDAAGDFYTGIENLRGSAFADDLAGNASRNVIEGGGGADTITDMTGLDVASYVHSSVGVTIMLGIAGAQISAGDANGDVLNGIDNLYGSTHVDSLTGNGNANTIRSFGGADTIKGMDGNDRVFISETPAMVDGGADFDVLNIEAGGSVALNDSNFQGFERVVAFDGSTVDMSGVPEGSFIRSSSTTGHSVTVDGTKGNDKIFGADGNDALRGGGGNDVIQVGEANQTIEGGPGNDLLFASTGEAQGGNPQDTFNMTMANFGRDTVRGSFDALSNDAFNVAGLGASMADLTFSTYGHGAIVTGSAGKAGDAVIFSNLTAEQESELNFHFDPPAQA